VESLEGDVASKRCSDGVSSSVSGGLDEVSSWVVLMRWDTCRDFGVDQNLATIDALFTSSFSEF